VKGVFTVESLQLEMANITADYQLLENISQQSGGEFYPLAQADKLQQRFTRKEAQGIIHSSESYLPLIENKLLLFILLALISMEWFIRKFSGSY
jgi:hypothetical protein